MAVVRFTQPQSQTYLANNPDVLNVAATQARAAGISPGPQFQTFVNQIAQDHFNTFGKNENRLGVPEGFTETALDIPNTVSNAPPEGSQTLSFTTPDPVNFTPVTSAISGVAGSIGTPATGQANTLMGQTQGLATGQQGIREVVDPLAGQITGIGTQIGTAGTGQANT